MQTLYGFHFSKEIVLPKIKEVKVYQAPMGGSFRDFKLASEYKALVDEDNNNHLFKIVSNKYTVVKHEDILEAMERAIKNNVEYGEPTVQIDLPDSGAKMKAVYEFKDAVVDIRGDEIAPAITLINSYDTSWSMKVLFGAIRCICTNGLVVGEKVFEEVHIHVGDVNPFRMIESLNKGMSAFSMQKKIWEKWVDKVLGKEDMDKYLDEMKFTDKQKGEIKRESEISTGETLTEKRITMWIFYNTVMQFITHQITRPMPQMRKFQQAAKVF